MIDCKSNKVLYERMKIMQITIHKVTLEDKYILQNLFELYDYEFSLYLDFELNEDGLYRKAPVNNYVSDDRFNSFFVKLFGKIVGFVVVKNENNNASYEIEQFFIFKKHSGKGIGRKVAFMIFDRYVGDWHVTQLERNYSAQAFWRSAIKQYTNNIYTESYDENRKTVQKFQNKTALAQKGISDY
jgi:predicted acetyltransferase